LQAFDPKTGKSLSETLAGRGAMSALFDAIGLKAAAAVLIVLAASGAAAAAEGDAAGAQPPKVPHTVAGYKVGRDPNDCVACHAPASVKPGARAMTDSHFVHRGSERLDKILATRVYCTQCHTAAPDAKPLPGAGQ
jgi:hypothetical protein